MDEPVIAARRPCVVTLEAGTHYWCRCGRSKTQPLCDGSHAGTGFEPVAFDVTEKKQLVLCACKHTKNQPMCDGSHRSLPVA